MREQPYIDLDSWQLMSEHILWVKNDEKMRLFAFTQTRSRNYSIWEFKGSRWSKVLTCDNFKAVIEKWNAINERIIT